MTAETLFKGLQPLDDFVYAQLAPAAGADRYLSCWEGVTHIGDFPVLLVIAWLVSLWIVVRRRRALLAAWFFGGFLLGQGVNTLIKILMARPRPFPYILDVPLLGASFPSGHTAGAGILALLLWVVWRETVRAGALRVFLQWGGVVVAVGIASSRVALGVHWFSDVYAAVFVAIAWVSLWTVLFKWTGFFSLRAKDLPHSYIKGF